MNPFRPKPGDLIEEVATPLPVIDEDILAANIARVQNYMNRHGIAFRPHIKTHKVVAVAKAQCDAGAVGINCQKITEAEVFAENGFDDILVTYNILGPQKVLRLAALNRRIGKLKVTADNPVVVEGLAQQFTERDPLTILVECDTGGGRCGVQSPREALELARKITQMRGLRFGGLMTYPKPGSAVAVETWLSQALSLLQAEGIPCPVVSNGGTPSLYEAHNVPSVTEHRAGTYVYNDRAMVRSGHCTLEQCAMHILTTVVSRPTADRAIIDAGSKGLSSDLLGFSDYGRIIEYPEAVLSSLSEEHGILDLSRCDGAKPKVGEKLRVLPNHTCVVSNLFDEMNFHRDGRITRIESVTARGMVW